MVSSYQNCACDFVDELPDFYIDLFPGRKEPKRKNTQKDLSRLLTMTLTLIEGEEGQQRGERRWNFGQNKVEGKP